MRTRCYAMGRADIADRLEEFAALLEDQQSNRFRVRAYRRGAEVVRNISTDPAEILMEGGIDGLVALEGIGESIAAAIAEMIETGRWVQLERLQGSSDPEALFRILPGVGPKTAQLIHDELHVDTYEALEVAAHDGRLERLKGIGLRKAMAIREALAQRLSRRRRRRSDIREEPGVALLLSVDSDYRAADRKGQLRRIAPRRHNPERRAWLPIMHVSRDGWEFTAVFSNTALAHRLGRTRDWVTLYFHRDDGPERQRTVVTETHGPLRGRRVVRGREIETTEESAK